MPCEEGKSSYTGIYTHLHVFVISSILRLLDKVSILSDVFVLLLAVNRKMYFGA